MSRIVLVTGMSGAGRTSALKDLEDLGFEAVDNLPATLLGTLVRPGNRVERDVAIGIDCRTRAFDPQKLRRQLAERANSRSSNLSLLFLDCDDEILRRRFTETRRRHPLGPDRPVTDGILRERQLMAPLRECADLVIDTSQLSTADLRQLIAGHFGQSAAVQPTLSVISFAYRSGLPREADLVFDVRFLGNPHYVDELRPLTGADPAVRAYVEADPAFGPLMAHLEALLMPLLPLYQEEGKSYLTIAFGCTGGRHRSVVVAESFAARLRDAGRLVAVQHRDTPEANRVASDTDRDSQAADADAAVSEAHVS
jgi:RNase adapter protein RapZ